MKLFKYVLGLIFILFISCKSQIKKIIVKDEIAVGDISIEKDTIYNGLIKFYDTATKKLIRESWYKNDTLNGEELIYYPNGKLNARLKNLAGKEFGYETIYDTTGEVLQKNYYYFDFHVGPILEYKGGKISEYKYYAFDNEWLFRINYDSIKNKKPENWQNDFFFYNRNYVMEADDRTNVMLQMFIYVLNPPLYPFKYSFCVVDSFDNVIKTIRNIDPDSGWDSFKVEAKEKLKNQFFAFKLEISEKEKIISTMYRRLNN